MTTADFSHLVSPRSQNRTRGLATIVRELTYRFEEFAAVLREACTCSDCVDPTDHQRHFVWANIPTNVAVDTCTQNEADNICVTWNNDIPGYGSDHVSEYTSVQIRQLEQHFVPSIAGSPQYPRRLWTRSTFDVRENTVSYEDYMHNDTALARILYLVNRDGLAFIDDVPGDQGSVNRLAERVGPLRTTFYGETWDVMSLPNATNVAYTSRYLGFHMDMLYVREPPGLQFLHCISNTCTGGESRFADTFSAADRLITQEGEEAFRALESLKVKYHYRRSDVSTTSIKPILDTAGHETKPPHNFINAKHPHLINKLHRVYWSPPFTGRALGNEKGQDFENQIQVSKAFHDILEGESSFIKTKVPAGTCAVFDNFRVVHAREAFDVNSGKRWLRVAYIDDSDFQSRVRVLQDEVPLSTVE